MIARCKLNSHLANECILTTVNCDFHFAGCEAWLMRRDMNDHLIKHAKEHAAMSLKENMLLTLDLAHFETTVGDCISLLEDREHLTSENQRLECELENLARELTELSQIDEIRRRDKMEIDRLTTALKQKDSVMKVQGSAVAGLKQTIAKLEAQLDLAVTETAIKESLIEERKRENEESKLEIEECKRENEQLRYELTEEDEKVDHLSQLLTEEKDENASLELELEKRDRIITELERQLQSSPRKIYSDVSL